MRHIRRAAVTGLFALWLAPLGAGAEGAQGSSPGCASGVRAQVEARVVASRREAEPVELRRERDEDEA